MSENSYVNDQKACKSMTCDDSTTQKLKSKESQSIGLEKTLTETKLIHKIINDLNNKVQNGVVVKRKRLMIDSFNESSISLTDHQNEIKRSNSEKESLNSRTNHLDEESAIIDSETELYESEYKQISKKHKAAASQSSFSFHNEEIVSNIENDHNLLNEKAKEFEDKTSISSDIVLLAEEKNIQPSSAVRKLKTLPEKATKVMKDWYEAHSTHPYPTDEERRMMAVKGNINENQVKAWFANKRNRSSNTKIKKPKQLLPKPIAPAIQVVNVNSNSTFTVPYVNMNQFISDSFNSSPYVFKNATIVPSTKFNNRQLITFLAHNPNNYNYNYNDNDDSNFRAYQDELLSDQTINNNQPSFNYNQVPNFTPETENLPITQNKSSLILNPDKTKNNDEKKKNSISEIGQDVTDLTNTSNKITKKTAKNNKIDPINFNGSDYTDYYMPNSSLIPKNNHTTTRRLITKSCLQPFNYLTKMNNINYNNPVSFNNQIDSTNFNQLQNLTEFPTQNKISWINSNQSSNDINNNLHTVTNNIANKSGQNISEPINNNNNYINFNNPSSSSPSNLPLIHTNDLYNNNINNNNDFISHTNEENNISHSESFHCYCDCSSINHTSSNYQYIPNNVNHTLFNSSFNHNNYNQSTPTNLNQQCDTPPPIITKNTTCNSNDNRKNSPKIKDDDQIDLVSSVNTKSSKSSGSFDLLHQTQQEINFNNQFKEIFHVPSSTTSTSSTISSSSCNSAFKAISNNSTSNNNNKINLNQPTFYQQDINDSNRNNYSINNIYNQIENINHDNSSLELFNQIKQQNSNNLTDTCSFLFNNKNELTSKAYNQFNFLMDQNQDSRFTDSKAKEWCINLHPRLSSTLLNLTPSHLNFKQFKHATRFTAYQQHQQYQQNIQQLHQYNNLLSNKQILPSDLNINNNMRPGSFF